MKNFMWICKHYFKRNILDISNLLSIALPILFALAYYLILNFQMTDDNAYERMATRNSLVILTVVVFQFFGVGCTVGFCHKDLKGATKARLLVSGIGRRAFLMAIVVSGLLYNIIQGVILVAFTSLVLDIDWGNYAIALFAIGMTALFSSICGIIIFSYTKGEKEGSRMSYFFGEIMCGLALVPIFLNVGMLTNVMHYLPVKLGVNMINAGTTQDMLLYAAIFVGQLIVVAAVAFFIGRETDK